MLSGLGDFIVNKFQYFLKVICAKTSAMEATFSYYLNTELFIFFYRIDQGYPTPAYQWFIAPLCHLMKENKPSCCLDLFKPCEHCSFTNALEYDFPNKPIIISVESVSVAIANFIVPLRHHLRPVESLSPIIILTEKKPDINVLAAISCYPEVYYCLGKIGKLEKNTLRFWIFFCHKSRFIFWILLGISPWKLAKFES